VGGYVATFAGEWLLSHPDWCFLDSIVRGEAENVIVPLVTAVLNKEPVHNLVGVATRDRPKSPKSLAVPVGDLNSIPWPARDLLNKNYAFMTTSRGCTGRCTFCSGPNARNVIGGKVWRGRSPEDVVDEIEFLVSKHGVDTFRINDLTYEDPGEIGKQRVRRIAELILQRGLSIHYQIYAQAFSWTERDTDLICLLHKSGLERVLLGIESGSDRVLRLLKKRASVKDNKRTIKLFRQAHIPLTIGFIMFHPYFEWQDIEDNVQFLVSENLAFNWLYFTGQLHVYPGTEIAEQLADDGLLEPDYKERLDPFAYRFVDPRIGQFARMANHLFSEAYLARRTKMGELHDRETRLSVYITRLLRSFGERPVVHEAVGEAQRELDAEKASLTEFNQAVFGDLLGYAKQGQDMPANMAVPIEECYAEASRRVKSIHLRLAMNLARQGKVFQVGRAWQLE
jgi:radical SAM superfamily enzyme YgiQ (UPF0313 family)